MTGFNHIVTGVAIAVTVQNPVLAPILSFFSHAVLDAVPHYDPGYRGPHQKPDKHFKFYIIFETILIPIVLLASVIYFNDHWLLVLGCAPAAFLPDILWLFEKHWGQQRHMQKFYRFHNFIQWGERPWGWSVEALYFIVLVSFLFRYRI